MAPDVCRGPVAGIEMASVISDLVIDPRTRQVWVSVRQSRMATPASRLLRERMDLARLAFVAIDLPGVGPVVIDSASGAIETWRHAGIKSKRWATGGAFVRDMIAERGQLPGAEEADPGRGAPAFSHEQASAQVPDNVMIAYDGLTVRTR